LQSAGFIEVKLLAEFTANTNPSSIGFLLKKENPSLNKKNTISITAIDVNKLHIANRPT
jgi:hypothetical protein